MEFEDILEEVGSYGPYQRNLLMLFAAPITFIGPFLSMSLIFVITVPDHWCHVPELISSNLSIHQQRALIEVHDNSHCAMRDLNYSELINKGYEDISDNTNATNCKYGWEYDKNDFEVTAATKWNMVCDHSHYPSLILTLQLVGSLIGTPIYGAMSDRLGRKITLFVAVFITVLTEIFSIVTSSFTFFAILKGISGAIVPTIISMPYILVTEVVTPNKRVYTNGVVSSAWMFGMCFLPLIAYLSRSWIILGIFNTLIGAIGSLYWKFIPESPVWLISMERYEEALNIMIRIGEKNKRILDKNLLYKKLKLLGERIKNKKEKENQNFCIYILKYSRFRKIFFIFTFCWIATLAAYNGLQFNVIELKGNKFLNFFLLSVVEAPGNIIFWLLMDRIGRRWSGSIGYIVTGIICLAPVTGLPYCEIISCVLGKLIISGVFMVIDQQSCELYPIVFRSFGISITKTTAKAATLSIPYIIYLGRYGKFIPFSIIGMLCILSGIFSAFLPETLSENLPQNISDLETFGKNQKFFSFNRRKQALDSSSTEAKENDAHHEKEVEPNMFAITATEDTNIHKRH